MKKLSPSLKKRLEKALEQAKNGKFASPSPNLEEAHEIANRCENDMQADTISLNGIPDLHGQVALSCKAKIVVDYGQLLMELSAMTAAVDVKALNQGHVDTLRWVARMIELRLQEYQEQMKEKDTKSR